MEKVVKMLGSIPPEKLNLEFCELLSRVENKDSIVAISAYSLRVFILKLAKYFITGATVYISLQSILSVLGY